MRTYSGHLLLLLFICYSCSPEPCYFFVASFRANVDTQLTLRCAEVKPSKLVQFLVLSFFSAAVVFSLNLLSSVYIAVSIGSMVCTGTGKMINCDKSSGGMTFFSGVPGWVCGYFRVIVHC